MVKVCSFQTSDHFFYKHSVSENVLNEDSGDLLEVFKVIKYLK